MNHATNPTGQRHPAHRHRAPLAFLLLAALLGLTSCGGGGGGGSSPPAPPAPSFALSTTQLTFTAASSSAVVNPQTVSASVSNVTAGTLYVLITGTGPAIGGIGLPTITGSNSAQSVVTPASASALGAGTFTGQITVKVCLNDATCNTGQLAGSPATINVTYQIDGLSLSPTAASITTIEGSASAPVNVQVSRLFGTQSWTSATTLNAGTPAGAISVSPTAGASLPASLAFSVPANSGLTVGNYGATTTVLSADGLSIPIPVNVNVQPKIHVSTAPTNLTNFTAAVGQPVLPAAQNLTVTGPGGETGYTLAVAYTQPAGVSNWLNVTANGALPGSITFAPNTTNPQPGTTNAMYYATVTLTPNSGGTPTVLYVDYLTNSDTLTASPLSAAIAYTLGSTGAAPSTQATFISNMGAVPWTGTVVYDSGPATGWLNAPASGTTGTPFALSANTTGLAAGFYRAHISASAGGANLTYPVTLSVHPKGVNFATPYGVSAGLPGTAVLRGFGFTGASSVSFGSTPATAFTIVNDTEIDAVYPALAAGSYAVQVGALASRASLQVVNPPAFAYGAISQVSSASLPGPIAAVVYDAGRQAIYAARNQTRGSSVIDIYTFSAGSWTAQTSALIANANTAQSLVLAPDGSQLYAVTSAGVQAYTLPAPPGAPVAASFQAIPGVGNLLAGPGVMTNDGGVVGLGSASFPVTSIVYRYDTLLQGVDVLNAPANVTGILPGMAIGSPDGSRVAFSNCCQTSPTTSYLARDGSFSTSPVPVYSQAGNSMSRDGTLLASTSLNGTSGTVMVVNLTTGVIVGYVNNVNSMGALSPDGSKLYTFTPAYYTPGVPNGVVHKFDMLHPNPTTNLFPEIGAGTPVTDSPGVLGQIVVTPDGGSLIIGGDGMIVVMPAP